MKKFKVMVMESVQNDIDDYDNLYIGDFYTYAKSGRGACRNIRYKYCFHNYETKCIKVIYRCYYMEVKE